MKNTPNLNKNFIIILILSLTLILAISGCGSKADSSSSSDFISPLKGVSGGNGLFTSFTAEDMNGNEITQDIFADYDVTMVNIWTTWCGYCIEEMPYLAELHTELPENVNMITICQDAYEETELALEILAESNAEFTTIAANKELIGNALSSINSYPTTIYIDSEGNLIGGVVGMYSKEDYESLINQALEALEI